MARKKKDDNNCIVSFSIKKGIITSIICSCVVSFLAIAFIVGLFSNDLKEMFNNANIFKVGFLFFVPLAFSLFLYNCAFISCLYESSKKCKK